MDHAFVVRGTLRDATHIELQEPLRGIDGAVEVVVRAVAPQVIPPRFASHEEWIRAFEQWADSGAINGPPLAPESLHREALYEDRT